GVLGALCRQRASDATEKGRVPVDGEVPCVPPAEVATFACARGMIGRLQGVGRMTPSPRPAECYGTVLTVRPAGRSVGPSPMTGPADVSVQFRGQDLNLRPPGYEPGELPLLHPEINF